MLPILLMLLKSAGAAFLSRFLGAAVTDKILSQLFFALADWFAKSTANGIDDKLVADIKEAYYKE